MIYVPRLEEVCQNFKDVFDDDESSVSSNTTAVSCHQSVSADDALSSRWNAPEDCSSKRLPSMPKRCHQQDTPVATKGGPGDKRQLFGLNFGSEMSSLRFQSGDGLCDVQSAHTKSFPPRLPPRTVSGSASLSASSTSDDTVSALRFKRAKAA